MDLEQSSLTTETPAAGTPSLEGQSGSPEAAPASGQQPAQTPTAQEILDYTKDERLSRMWSNPKTKSFDPNLMYKSVKSADDLIEKQYKPLRAQADSFTKFLKDYGFEPDTEKLKPIFDEYKSFKDPENPVIKRSNYFSYFYDNPEYKADIENLFEGMRKKEIRKQFGEGVSDEIVKEILDNRKFREEQVQKEKMATEEAEHKKLVGTIEQGWEKVKSQTAKLGFPVTDEIRVKLLEQCAKEGIPPNAIYGKFLEMYEEEIFKHNRAKVQSDLTKKQVQTRKNGVIPGSSVQSKGASVPAGKESLFDRVAAKVGLKT